ncbi:hypothetical protein ACJMK2_042426 [Sinanodonta woodiana]|uniref:Uncharacterized protein n=1 Tax=Sinanodonta woodiana TaxID=1069815 RepID=A0ABD3W7D6_SINWO
MLRRQKALIIYFQLRQIRLQTLQQSPQCPVRSHLEPSTKSLNNTEPVPSSDDCSTQCDPVQPAPSKPTVPNGPNSPNTPVRTLRGRVGKSSENLPDSMILSKKVIFINVPTRSLEFDF